MIKILIVEDNSEKLRKVLAFLTEECSLQESDIDCAANVKSARNFIVNNHYDLLLLDLVLPINDESEPSSEAGINFLDEIYYNSNINIPIHIIGLTEFDNIFEEHSGTFEDKLWSLVNFNISNNDWKEKLRSKVCYLINYKTKFQEFIQSKNKYDIAIITALNTPEFEQVKKLGLDWKKKPDNDDPIIYYEAILNTKGNNNLKIITCSINQMGMQACSSVASKVISLFSPKYIFICGICAGIKERGVNLGDVIIGTQAWDYESGKYVENETGELVFKPEIHILPTDQGILSKLAEFSTFKETISKIYNEFDGNKPDTQLKIHAGPVGSGPYVLSSKKFLSNLIEKERKLIAIDMEGYGVYKAAQFHFGTSPVFIKSVCDFGDNSKNDNYQSYAAYTSARFVYEFLYNQY